MKVANIEQRKCSYLLNELRNFNETFRKDMTYDNIKSHKKVTFGKTKGWGGQIDTPTAVLGLKRSSRWLLLNWYTG